MNIGKFGKLAEMMKVGKTPTKPTPVEKPKPPKKPVPSQLNPVETLTKPPRSGSATAILGTVGDPVKAFKKASSGTPIKIAQTKEPLKAFKSLMDYAKTNLSDSEMKNVVKFIGQMDVGSKTPGQILGEGLQKTGITTEQLDMIANGEISGKQYMSMLKEGDPSS